MEKFITAFSATVFPQKLIYQLGIGPSSRQFHDWPTKAHGLLAAAIILHCLGFSAITDQQRRQWHPH